MVPAAECIRLHRLDKSLRFGVAHLPGRGRTIFVAKLVERNHVGGDDMSNRPGMAFMPHDCPGFEYMQDRKGRIFAGPKDWDGKVPMLFGWPGQSLGNNAVMTGDYVSYLIYNGRPHYVLEEERREATAAAGREKDRIVKDAAYEGMHYHKHLQKNHNYGGDPLVLKEDLLKDIKKSENAGFLRTLDNAKEDSFEAESLRNAGFKT